MNIEARRSETTSVARAIDNGAVRDFRTASDVQRISDADKASFHRNGYLIIRNAFTPEEVHRMRLVMLEQFLTYGGFAGRLRTIRSAVVPDAFNRDPRMAEFVMRPRLMNALRDLIEEDLYYLHHSDIHMNWSGGWHRDSIDKPSYYDFVKTDIWAAEHWADYKVLKIGIYLQDHSFNDEGLNVVPGSHRERSARRPTEAALKSHVGDAVIFDTRIVHRGVLSHQLEGSKTFIDGSNRLSIFSSYGANNIMSREFAEGTVWRQNMQTRQPEYVLNPKLERILNERGLNILPISNRPMPQTLTSMYSTMI